MASLVKEVNWRVKGTEMFWNNPDGAEAILQVRAAALCDDGRLKTHLQTRPGCPFTRRPKPASLTGAKIKSLRPATRYVKKPSISRGILTKLPPTGNHTVRTRGNNL